jgi:tetratricopeptide (TPR) repeat protein
MALATKSGSAASAPLNSAEDMTREERLVAWVQANRKFLGIAGGALALVLIIAWFLAVSARRKEDFARTQLEQAYSAQDAGNLPLASSEFQRVVTNYAGTEAATEARLALNQARLLNGQQQLAVDDLRELVAGRPDPRFGGQAAMLLGAGLENLTQPAEAAAAYETAAAQAPLDFQKSEALLAAARAWQAAGDTAKAIAHLRTIVERYQETASFPLAEIRLAELTTTVPPTG